MIKLFCMLGMIISWHAASAQTPVSTKSAPKVEVYYFHPAERCPIDQSIEETTRKLMRTDFAFSTCQSNNARFRAALKEDILEALKH